MSIQLSKGARFNLSKEAPNLSHVAIGLGWELNNFEKKYDLDASVFMLGTNGKIPDERYFIFYNNPKSIDNSVNHSGDNRTGQGQGDDEAIFIDLEKVDSIIQEMVFVVTIHEGHENNQSFSQIKNSFIRLFHQETGSELARYDLNESFSQETALEFGRLYKKDGEWKFHAVGEGYKGGLQSFVNRYYIENKQEENKTPSQVNSQKDNLTNVLPQQATPQLIDIKKKANINLLKTKVDICLKKKGIDNVIARVALVLDISGSMLSQYTSGAVQAFLERIVPVASKLDDNATLDVWFFGSTFKRTNSVQEVNTDGYIQKQYGEMKRTLLFFKMPSLMLELGGGNNESLVIQDVIKKYTKEQPSKLPTLVVFLSDGGITDEPEIKKSIVEAAKYPIFWQFVGLAGFNYGILEKLDTMKGRVVDNANFFHVDDLGKITDEQLYERLLNEFPSWIKNAKSKKILK